MGNLAFITTTILALLLIINKTIAHDDNANASLTKRQCYVCNSARDRGCGNSTILKTKEEWKKDCETLEDYKAIIMEERIKYKLPQQIDQSIPLQLYPVWTNDSFNSTLYTYMTVCKKMTFKLDRNQPEIKEQDRDNVTGDAKIKRFQRYCGIQIMKVVEVAVETNDPGYHHHRQPEENGKKDSCNFTVTNTASKLEINTCVCHENLCNGGSRTAIIVTPIILSSIIHMLSVIIIIVCSIF